MMFFRLARFAASALKVCSITEATAARGANPLKPSPVSKSGSVKTWTCSRVSRSSLPAPPDGCR